jgi:hypothetical protein
VVNTVSTLVIEAAIEALVKLILEDSVVALCAREELTLVNTVSTLVIEAASEALLVRMLDDSVVML